MSGAYGTPQEIECLGELFFKLLQAPAALHRDDSQWCRCQSDSDDQRKGRSEAKETGEIICYKAKYSA